MPAASLPIPLELASLQSDSLDGGGLYCSLTCWYNSRHSCNWLELCFCGLCIHHPTVVMLLECLVGLPPDPETPGQFLLKLDEAIPNSYLCCEPLMRLLLVASSIGDECRCSFCIVNCQLPSVPPVNTHSGAGFPFYDNLVCVASSHHPSNAVNKVETLVSGHPLLNPIHECCCVICEEVERLQWTVWYTSFNQVSLFNIPLDHHLHHLVCSKSCHASYELSVHLLTSDVVSQSPPSYAREGNLVFDHEYTISVAPSPGSMCYVDHDGCLVDCWLPFPASIVAIA